MESDKEERSRVLVIGGTGHIGKHIVAASVRSGHSTSVLIRDAALPDPAKAQLLTSFVDSGVALIKGDLFNHESLVKAIKSTDIIISAVGPRQLAEQTRIVTAIKEAGNVKRFLPSEFGSDVERVHTVDPMAYAKKFNLRCLIEAEGIPHTYICCNGFDKTYLPRIGYLTTVGAGPPSDKITVLGDGDAKAVFVVEEDIALYTMRAVDDLRTVNKILYMRPPANIKRFLPSEFGSDVERAHTVDPLASLYAKKFDLRRLIEAEGIPHTYICCNGFAETYLPRIGDLTTVGAGPPSDKITVLGDGDAKEDIAVYTMRVIDDPRTLNKILYMMPPANIISHNELISMWERKVVKTLQIVRIPEVDLLEWIKEAAFPLNILLSLALSIFVRGDQANFENGPSFGVEATELYPDVKYTTVDEHLNCLL